MDRSSEQCTLSPKVHGSIPDLANLLVTGKCSQDLFTLRKSGGQSKKEKKRQTSKRIFAFASALTQAFACCEWALRMLKSVMDPRFPKGGVIQKGGVTTYYLANLSRKLHEHEENWTGRCAFKILLCRSITANSIGVILG